MNRLLVSVSVGALAALCSTTAMAQQAPPDRATTIDEVIVTAQRREQAAQDVGIALSVLSGESLVQQGVTNVNQLQNATPNLEVEPAFGGGAAQFRMRGVGFQDYASNNSPTVGVYVNEVAYPVPVMTQGLIFDIDRVEVLRVLQADPNNVPGLLYRAEIEINAGRNGSARQAVHSIS